MSYKELSIHQKINVKSRAFRPDPTQPVFPRVLRVDPWIYGDPDRLPMRDNGRFDLKWNQSFS